MLHSKGLRGSDEGLIVTGVSFASPTCLTGANFRAADPLAWTVSRWAVLRSGAPVSFAEFGPIELRPEPLMIEEGGTA